MIEKVLEVKNLTKKYGYITALNNITFQLTKGDLLALLGPNGAGKTTLLKLLGAQMKPSSGEILYNNRSVSGTNHYKKILSVISHKSFLYDDLTAYQNLFFFAKLYNLRDIKNKVLFVLDQVGLIDRKDEYIKHFSRGMVQRLTIARAFIHTPEIIFMDEPYTGLDRKATDLLTEIISNKKNERNILILVTHNVNIAFSLATKIAVLKNGNLVYFEDKLSVSEKDFNEYFNNISKIC